jgi:hypothetical protein
MLTDLSNSIEKYIPQIQLHFNIRNAKPCDGGRYYTSLKYLDSIKHRDVVTGESTYMYSFSDLRITDKLYNYAAQMYPDYTPIVSGHFYYPPRGYMGWHTNSDKPEKHLYFTYANKGGKSFFRSFVDGKIITDYDVAGVNVREFDISSSSPYYWHCVYSDCDRYSFGFRLNKKDEK